VFNQWFTRAIRHGTRIRVTLVNLIYKKSLRLSLSSGGGAGKQSLTTTTGHMVNLVSINAQAFNDLPCHLSMLWTSCVSIAITMILLFGLLGVASLAGLFLLVLLLVPLTSAVTSWSKRLQLKQYVEQDARIKAVSELLSGIKVVKLYGWEVPLRDMIVCVRRAELHIFTLISNLTGFSNFVVNAAPFMVSAVSFGLYIVLQKWRWGDQEPLNAEKVFVSLALFNGLRQSLSHLPSTLSSMIQVLLQ
jgi:ABC-type multidrug transport system fused ATPase/permease subunit